MSTDSPRGFVTLFEDFLGDVIADHPEYGVDTDPAIDILTATDDTGLGGVLRFTLDAGQANIGGIGLGTTVWNAYKNSLSYEVRFKFSALGTASERVFFGFGDVQADTFSEMPFTGATTVLTASGDPDDAVGFFWEGDMTGAYLQPGSIDSDSVVIGTAANAMTASERALATITAGQWHTAGFRIDSGATYAEFYFDGKLVYVYKSSTPLISDVALLPCVVATEGTTAINLDIDYIEVKMGRDD